MRVNLPDYRFYRTLDGYFIAPIANKKAVFDLYQFVNNYKTKIGTYTIVDGFISTDPVEIPFPEEGSYIVSIQGFTESKAKDYYIRYYPTLRSRLIPTVRALICDCPLTTANICTNGQFNASSQHKNDINMAINAIIALKDIFISPCFIKNVEFGLRLFLGESIERYYTRLSTYLDYIDEYGYTPDTESLLRELMAFTYTMAYFAEISTVEYDYVATGGTQGSLTYNDGELEAVQEEFNFASLEDCYYTRFNVNINEVLAKISNAIEEQVYACITGVSAFLSGTSIVHEEIIDVDLTGEEGEGNVITTPFVIGEDSLVFVNGVGVPSTDFAYSGNTVTFKYFLNINDRVTIIK